MILGFFALENRTLLDRLDCLIVQATDGRRGRYRRVGLLAARGASLPQKMLDDAKSTVLEESFYQGMDEETRYTIEIV